MKHTFITSIICLFTFSCIGNHQTKEQIIVHTFKDTIFKDFITEKVRDSILQDVLIEANKAYMKRNEELRYNGVYLIAQLNGFPEFRRNTCQESSDFLNNRIDLLTQNRLNEIYQDSIPFNLDFSLDCITDSIHIQTIAKEESRSLYKLSFKDKTFKVVSMQINKDSTHYSIQEVYKNKKKALQVIWKNNGFATIVE